MSERRKDISLTMAWMTVVGGPFVGSVWSAILLAWLLVLVAYLPEDGTMPQARVIKERLQWPKS